MAQITVTVSGSFHRHIEAIMEAVKTFNELGVQVLSPADPRVVDSVVDSVNQFLFVASDKHRSIRLVQDRHLSAITQSNFLWLVTPDGYIGQSASLELGFAIAYGTPIFSEVMPPDLTIRQYVEKVINAKEAIRIIQDRQQSNISYENLLINPHSSIETAHQKLEFLDQILAHPEKTPGDLLEYCIAKESQEVKALLAIPSHN